MNLRCQANHVTQCLDTVPPHSVHDPTPCTIFQNSTLAFNLLLLNHIDVFKPNSLIQYSEVVLGLSSSNKIYRNRTGSLIWRPERNGREFDRLFVFCNCNSSVAVIESPLVSFECSMTVESSYSVDLIVKGRLRKCDRTKRTRFLDLPTSSSSIDRFSPTLAF